MTTAGNRELTRLHAREQDSIELALRDSQARMSGIISSAMDAIITVDEHQRIILFNKSAENMFGYPAGDILGKPLEALLPERFRERHRQHIHHFAATGVTNRSMGRLSTLYGLRSDGSEFPIEASISQLTAAEGKLYTVILRDVTERVKAEESLIESEQYLRATFEQAAVGISHTAPDGHILRVNQKLCEITGYSQEELLARTFKDITHPDDLATYLTLHDQLFSGQLQSYSRENRYICKDGSIVWVNLSASLVRDIAGNAKYVIKVIEDITQRKVSDAALQAKTNEMKTMAQQLWQTAKLATMGELAASIAHELNNPLAILSLRIESVLSSMPTESELIPELKVMEHEVDRMASLVTNLLQFSRSSERQISSLKIENEVDQTLELVQNYLVHRHVSVQREFAINLPLIQADQQQLRQLFLNLITNATDAMPTGGLLRIRIEAEENHQCLKIEVIDTGIGIQPENIRSVLEPFFTTKPEGKGTGLGLAICRRIIEEHNGSIQIFSDGKDKGTTITMILPSSSQAKNFFISE